MRVGVAGAGAVGAHYGLRLQQAGADVILLARGEHGRVMKRSGLRYASEGVEQYYPVCVVEDAKALAESDVILVCCKTTQLTEMLSALKASLDQRCVLVSMQNGVTAPQLVAQAFPQNPVLAASAFIGARLEQPGWLIHSAAGHLRMGFWQGEAQKQSRQLLALWQNAHVDAQLIGDVRAMLWNKMLWNCGFNALTALTRRYARDIVADAGAREIILMAMQEALSVAQADGVNIKVSAIEQHLALTMKGGEVKTSMWQDLENGRLTEIDAMNGEVVRLAEKYGVDTPVNSMLTTMLHLAQEAVAQ
ncbi:MAG: hypothetical protein CO186_06630 [Zetaproteobacteria bacterium CG_4_9_14_3_um_filter_49_83]|nr:MAG: hypothetical protein AUJ56_06935 [Zetaproteobacteria bacterium CG1_02_49_23]PIQ30646.1 MAG: hypothetical protein COW62_11750 [Zetaproteobacteria bacterium CG17_big_fil_post_rev_8_21_14_2_50_50_13]PIV30198.1 MAG: hypothetical protein COS35_07965 [Zetaproteobacteria bacterium CG02_land_8_20_14_3_00_50_9]PIY55108.1 MAG: hypothetical protein COZ00_11145 [Zetaproteobacteria bacterium CG_4_10_14_0_8_um_filter_49_80]PJA35285.1 MAG: hypothetical protein CO186_06630 [Zetaproteobacteria bacterium